ncbi:MAG: EVE domain-containing protein [Planctomycetes bacterium]|jgi:predicted RNA-binding protein with PUA-like domain|nr:EVE domain-containing protein [Planctomycetota bacterium]
MQYWLLKSEPGTWSWDDQIAAPRKTTVWDGVRNHQANNFMKQMSKGDRCFFYHSVNEKRIVGVVEVVKEHKPDPSDQTGKGFGMVTVRAVEAAAVSVTLADIKGEPKLAEMVLVKNSRLSVQPVQVAEWRIICKMAGLKG